VLGGRWRQPCKHTELGEEKQWTQVQEEEGKGQGLCVKRIQQIRDCCIVFNTTKPGCTDEVLTLLSGHLEDGDMSYLTHDSTDKKVSIAWDHVRSECTALLNWKLGVWRGFRQWLQFMCCTYTYYHASDCFYSQ